jgi:hypothetical protein
LPNIVLKNLEIWTIPSLNDGIEAITTAITTMIETIQLSKRKVTILSYFVVSVM